MIKEFMNWSNDMQIQNHNISITKCSYIKFNLQKLWHEIKLTCNQQFQIILNYFNKHFDQQNFWDQWSRNTYRIFHGNSCKIEIEFWGYTIVQIYTNKCKWKMFYGGNHTTSVKLNDSGPHIPTTIIVQKVSNKSKYFECYDRAQVIEITGKKYIFANFCVFVDIIIHHIRSRGAI